MAGVGVSDCGVTWDDDRVDRATPACAYIKKLHGIIEYDHHRGVDEMIDED